jgi:hypothetical protein
MKTQKITFVLIVLSILFSQTVLTSCSGTDKVVSSSFIQKRKYTQGFHFGFSFKNKRKRLLREIANSSPIKVKANTTSEEIFISDDKVSCDEIQVVQVAEKCGMNKVIGENAEKKAVLMNGAPLVISTGPNPQKTNFHPMTNPSECNHRSDVKESNGSSVASIFFAALEILSVALPLLGLSWLFLLLFIPSACLALAFGIKGIKQLRENNENQKGGWMATMGIILGSIGLAIPLLLVLGFILFMTSGGFNLAGG